MRLLRASALFAGVVLVICPTPKPTRTMSLAAVPIGGAGVCVNTIPIKQWFVARELVDLLGLAHLKFDKRL